MRAVHLPGSTTFEKTVQFGWGEAELQPKCKAQMIHSEQHVRVDPIIPVRFLLNTTYTGFLNKHFFFFFYNKSFQLHSFIISVQHSSTKYTLYFNSRAKLYSHSWDCGTSVDCKRFLKLHADLSKPLTAASLGMCSRDYVYLGLRYMWLPTGNFTCGSRRLGHTFRGLAASKYGTKPRFPPRFHWWELKDSNRMVRISISCKSKNCIYYRRFNMIKISS